MSRCIVAMTMLLLLAAPALATVYYTNDTNPDINIYLTIDCFTNIYWNNTDADHTINFSPLVQDGSNAGDWWRDATGGVRGAYGTATKSSQDAYATGYYESYDAAFFWLDSNCNVDMTVTDAGDLSNGSATLPTWYTIALTNNTGGGGGFIDNATRQTCGAIPLDGQGTYAQDSNGDNSMTLFACTDDGAASAFYPNQWPFPMGSSLAPMGSFTGFAQGTVLFHARVERNGFADAAGTYTSSIDMTFNNP